MNKNKIFNNDELISQCVGVVNAIVAMHKKEKNVKVSIQDMMFFWSALSSYDLVASYIIKEKMEKNENDSRN